MFELSSSGSFGKTDAFFAKIRQGNFFARLDEYGRQGVSALASATPLDTGKAASSWYYNIVRSRGSVTIEWRNDDLAGSTGTPVVILLQYGHGTGTGGYVQGRDFINPAIKPVMDKIAADVWKAVTS